MICDYLCCMSTNNLALHYQQPVNGNTISDSHIWGIEENNINQFASTAIKIIFLDFILRVYYTIQLCTMHVTHKYLLFGEFFSGELFSAYSAGGDIAR